MKSVSVLSLSLFAVLAARADTLATFDDLPNGPTVATPTRQFIDAAGSASYDGVIWDSRLYVANVSYKLSPDSPDFGASHSGDTYLVTADDGIMLTTDMVLTSAWFGRATFYGFGGGTDQVTINALHGSTVLDSVTMDLPLTNPGHTEPLVKMDTSAFLSFSGITGYEIDRRETDPTFGANNWIGDDFDFVATPEPGWAAAIAGLILGAGAGFRAYRRR